MPKEPKQRNKKVTNAKNKGREFTKRVRKMFVEAFGLSEESARCAVGYEQGCDIKFLEEAQKKVGLYIECKNAKTISLGPWMEQMLKNTPKGGVPALIYHKPVQGNSQIWITLPLEEYLKMRRDLWEAEEQLS